MKGLEAYRMYLAMRNHFRSKSYNFLKSPYSKAKPETYDKRKDKYFFVKLSRKYDEKQLAQFYLSNFLADNCEWIGAMSANGERNYIEYQKEYNHYRTCFALTLKSCVRYVTILIVSSEDHLIQL